MTPPSRALATLSPAPSANDLPANPLPPSTLAAAGEAPALPAAARALRIVVPARDEEERIAACLDALEVSVEFARWARPEVDCQVWVVADSCRDRTWQLVAERSGPSLQVMTASCAKVGAARRLGIQQATRAVGVLSEQVWVACTDADSLVGRAWAAEQLAASETADLVFGGVRLDPHSAPLELQHAWWQRHPAGSEHVHGANLGFRLSSYLRAGGFAAVAEHEDVDLVRRLRAIGVREATASEVTTSARATGRTPGGFAGYIRGLHAEGLAPCTACGAAS